jgi:hypothetical protein
VQLIPQVRRNRSSAPPVASSSTTSQRAVKSSVGIRRAVSTAPTRAAE